MMQPTYKLSVIFNHDAKYTWHLIPVDNGATFKSSTTLRNKEDAQRAGEEFARLHNLTIQNIYYQ